MPVLDEQGRSWRLVETCGACPEQYDLLRDGEREGYFRLRHGFFYVESPWVDGETVYTAHPDGDGMFDHDEREFYLREGVLAVLEHLYRADPAAGLGLGFQHVHLAEQIVVGAERPGRSNA